MEGLRRLEQIFGKIDSISSFDGLIGMQYIGEIHEAGKIVAELIKKEKASKWISVDDRLPDADVIVLGYWRTSGLIESVMIRPDSPAISHQDLEVWWCNDELEHRISPTHWQTLPKAPKEGPITAEVLRLGKEDYFKRTGIKL